MIIDDVTINAVRNLESIETVISDYVSLKKKGKNYLGLCPFHSEKTPSFNVSPEKKLFHCFGCNESGDLIAFLMKVDNLSFKEAIENICQRVGIPIQYKEGHYTSHEDEKAKDLILSCLLEAKRYYQEALKSTPSVMKYLVSRGLKQETIDQFELGFADPSDGLKVQLSKQGFTTETLVNSGLFYQHETGLLRHRFRGRLMIPVNDHLSRTVAFGGRDLSEEKQVAKYINSPETTVFNKKFGLFAMDKAKSAIRKKGDTLVMEGYMDVMMAFQYGFDYSVGSMGTALTLRQVQLIKRFSNRVYLSFDSDKAGKEAAYRSIEQLTAKDLAVNVLVLDEKDPADVLNAQGQSAFESLIKDSLYYLDYALLKLQDKYDISDIHQTSQLVDALVPLMKMENDSIVINHFVTNLALKLKVNRELILAKLKNFAYIESTKKYTPTFNNKTKYQKAEEWLICAMASNLEIRSAVFNEDTETLFHEPEHKSLLTFMRQKQDLNHELIAKCEDEKVKQTLIGLLVAFNQKPGLISQQECTDCLTTLAERHKKQEINHIKKILSEDSNLDDSEQVRLMERLRDLLQ